MKKVIFIILATLVVMTSPVFHYRFAESAAYTQKDFAPPDKVEGKVRIGYCETDPFTNYAGTFYALLQGLHKLGWVTDIRGIPYKHGDVDTKKMWDWLVAHDTGPYIEFVENAHYSLKISPEGTEEKLINRLKNTNDIDLMIVMGTFAGNRIATDQHDVPTLVFSTSNAVGAGIVKSAERSGHEHIWAHVDPNRYIKQVEVFYDLFQFEKMGMLYEDSEVGRSSAAVGSVKKAAAEKSFDIIPYHVDEPKSQLDKGRYVREVEQGFQTLAGQVDAMYLTYGLWDTEQLSELLTPFYRNQVPVFSQLGREEVAHGALLSVSRADFNGVGLFGAKVIGRVLNGAHPGDLSQIYGNAPSITLNMEVADRIGYEAPFEILLVADKIYNSIAEKNE